MKTPHELFGWEIGAGWKPLVEELIARLKAETDWNGTILQVKEKFGGLRFYIGSGSDKIFDLINEYEQKSYTVCEDCGEPGRPRSGGWVRTLCDRCEQLWKAGE